MQKRVRAIIIENNSLLTIKRVRNSQIYWVFPGGGVEVGENDIEALTRECKEELGVEIIVKDLVFENLLNLEDKTQQKQYFYRCEIISGELGKGTGLEYQVNSVYEGTYEIKWLKLVELANFDLRPEEIRNLLSFENVN